MARLPHVSSARPDVVGMRIFHSLLLSSLWLYCEVPVHILWIAQRRVGQFITNMILASLFGHESFNA